MTVCASLKEIQLDCTKMELYNYNKYYYNSNVNLESQQIAATCIILKQEIFRFKFDNCSII